MSTPRSIRISYQTDSVRLIWAASCQLASDFRDLPINFLDGLRIRLFRLRIRLVHLRIRLVSLRRGCTSRGLPNRAITGRGVEIDNACNWDPAIRLRDMDKAGVDVSVMFPSQSDGLCMLNDVGFESAMHRAYHRFMTDYCAESDGRLRWVADASLRDIPDTIAELKRLAKEDESFAGVFVSRSTTVFVRSASRCRTGRPNGRSVRSARPASTTASRSASRTIAT